MRKMLLATAVALGPLCVATGAMAETVISTNTTTPIQTATANNGAPDDVRISSSGTVNVTAANTAAVTLNSPGAKVTNQGTISMENLTTDGQTGILIVAGGSGSVDNAGQITITDDLSRPDSNNNGFGDGPWAHGSNRFGIHALGDFTGDILNETAGAVIVHGNNSAAIAIDGTLTGNFTNAGSFSLFGDNGYAVHLHNVTGALNIKGGVTVNGAGSTAVQLDGDVGGRVSFGGTINNTGYSVTTHPTSANDAKLDPSEKQIGGAGLVVAGNMAHGVLLDSPPTTSTTNPDVDGDGVADNTQGGSSINIFGTAPALKVGSSAKDITLGVVGTTVAASAADYNYGLILKGSITANSVFDHLSAIGVDIGDTSGNGHAVNIAGGIRNSGSIITQAYENNSIALRLGNNTFAPSLLNSGTITANTDLTTPAGQAIAVLMTSGSHTATLTNSGAISANVFGSGSVAPASSAIAIADFSGALTDIENRGAIFTGVGPDTSDPNTTPADEAAAHSGVAIEASANTTGLTLHQFKAAAADGDPLIVGAINLGSGADTVNIEAGSITGDVNFGTATAGNDSLSITGGSTVTGKILDGDGHLNIAVTDGTLLNKNPAQLTVNNLSVGTKGTMIVTIDPNAAGDSGFKVNGSATLADGSTLGTRFSSLLQPGAPTLQFTLIQANAGQLTIGSGANISSVTANTPYLFVVTPKTDQVAAGRLYVEVSRRTAAEAGMTASQTAAYDPVYQALNADTALRTAFLDQTTRNGFFNLYNQLLPDHSGAQLFSLASGVDAVSRALGDRRPAAAPGETSGWVQEINFYSKKDDTSSFGFTTNGFGVASGVERGGSLGAVGVSLAFTSSDQKDPFSQGDENLSSNLVEAGLYWRAGGEHWRAWTRAAAGYAWLDSVRQFVYVPSTSTTVGSVVKKSTANWTGYTASAAGGVSYEMKFGRWFARPELNAEYFYLSEEAHREGGGGTGFDLDIGKRAGHIFQASAMLNIGGKFGPDGWLQPEIHIGYRDNVSVDGGTTTASFIGVAGGTPFSLLADNLEGGGPVAGFRILANGGMGFLALEGDADLMKAYKRYQLMIRAGYRF